KDVDLTHKLYTYAVTCLGMQDQIPLITKYSHLASICLDYRVREVHVDLKAARAASIELEKAHTEATEEMYRIAGQSFNPKSSHDLKLVLDNLKVQYPLTERGNMSATSPWLETQEHAICKAIVEVRRIKNMK